MEDLANLLKILNSNLVVIVNKVDFREGFYLIVIDGCPCLDLFG